MAINKNIKAFIWSTLSALLCFVIVFNLSVNAFHIQTEDHHHTEQTCSPDEENDACHRYLIHHEKSKSCNGEHEHYSNKSEDCFTCNYFKNQQPSFKVEGLSSFIPEVSFTKHSFQEVSFKTSFSLSVFSRGPPTIS